MSTELKMTVYLFKTNSLLCSRFSVHHQLWCMVIVSSQSAARPCQLQRL